MLERRPRRFQAGVQSKVGVVPLETLTATLLTVHGPRSSGPLEPLEQLAMARSTATAALVSLTCYCGNPAWGSAGS